MAYKETIKHLRDLLYNVSQDLIKAEGGNKAAAQRVRTGTVKLEKIAKIYRKESIRAEKTGFKATTSKKVVKKKVAVKPKAKVKAKASFRPKAKAHALKAHKTIARPKALSFKKPSAKLPIRRAGAR